MSDLVLPSDSELTADELAEHYEDAWWRVTSGRLYKIMIKEDTENYDDEGNLIPNDDYYTLPFIPNDAQIDFLRKMWHRNLILKARQFGFCLDPNTKVLTADLEWVRIEDLRPGTEIVSVDEYPPGGRGRGRKMRTGEVVAAVRVNRKAYRISFCDGRSVVCTGQHPWLSKKTITKPEWRTIEGTKKLKVGTKVRWITKPWGDDYSFEDGWFAGMLDGEGSMALKRSSGSEINVAQVEGPVWDRLVNYCKSSGYAYRIEIDNQPERLSKYGKRAVHKVCFSRMDDIFRLLGKTRPSRFLGNRFWEGKELPGKRNGGVGWSTIVGIEELGEQPMIDLQTTTGTYIAEGFVSHNTTLICVVWLDHALFVKNQRCGIVAHERESAEAIFKDKVKFAYDNLPKFMRQLFPLKRDTMSELQFKHNNSSIRVATSVRSGTIHRLHISEFGKICAKFPERAKEVVTGSMPAVPLNAIQVIESTAEGDEGYFYNYTVRAQALQEEQKQLTQRDNRFFFYGWWMNPEYKLDPAGVLISDKDSEYFEQVEAEAGITLEQDQRAWYVATRDADYPEAPELMWQEYPSTWKEAFQRSTEGRWLTKQMTAMRRSGRICEFPVEPSVHCWSFWDIGASDGTAVWVIQKIGPEFRVVHFKEGWDEPYNHFTTWLQSLGLTFEGHYLPHDADHRRQGAVSNKSPRMMLEQLLPGARFFVVDRIDDITWGIQQLRDVMHLLWMHAVNCKEGIPHLDKYKKKFDTKQQRYSRQPEKNDGHSEAADALRQFAQAYKSGLLNVSRPSTTRKRRNWRTA